MQISFTKKIPVNTCNIYDKRRRKFVEATVYEIDCKDKSDIDYIKGMKGNWIHKDQISYGVERKHNRVTGENALFWKHANEQGIEDNGYYSLEGPNEEIICVCETEPFGREVDISFLESAKGKRYKYAGQTMLASIANNIFGSGQILTVKAPANSAMGFYEDKCGFRKNQKYFGYEMSQEDMQGFIQRTEEKTRGKILNCQG